MKKLLRRLRPKKDGKPASPGNEPGQPSQTALVVTPGTTPGSGKAPIPKWKLPREGAIDPSLSVTVPAAQLAKSLGDSVSLPADGPPPTGEVKAEFAWQNILRLMQGSPGATGLAVKYLRAACDYVHLNPARARLVSAEESLERYTWSSYPAYLQSKLRPPWLRTDRLLGEHGKQATQQHLRLFAQGMEARRQDGHEDAAQSRLSSSWSIGAEDFAAWLAEKLGRRGSPGEFARERRETDAQLASRLVEEGLSAAGWSEESLRGRPKGHAVKVALARRLRQQTPMTRAWIAQRLHMGSPSYLSALLSVDSKL